jgi:FAD/FMN-containing dehydrogenase
LPPTHIDDFVESLRVVTPAGTLGARRLPGSGAAHSRDGLFIGSEGVLGVITEAWMRLQGRPTFRASRSLWFPDFSAAARAVRVIGQAGLYTANCRILDPNEVRNTGAGDWPSSLPIARWTSGRPDPGGDSLSVRPLAGGMSQAARFLPAACELIAVEASCPPAAFSEGRVSCRPLPLAQRRPTAIASAGTPD